MGNLSVEEAIDLFPSGDYEGFHQFLSAIPREQRFENLRKMIDKACEKYGPVEGNVISRRIAHHPHFTPFFQELPTLWEQGIFFANLPFLKTRVALSFFDHPSIRCREVDYSCLLYNQGGNLVFKRNATIRARETHSFEVGSLVKPEAAPFGMLCIQTAEEDMNSLRIYAYWYNENSMTTTHEKKALANTSPLLVYPTVVCNEQNQTYLAICNGAKDPMKLQCQLFNVAGENHPESLNLSFPPRCSGLIPLDTYFKDMRTFLKDGPGVLHVQNDNQRGLYYYFIHNKELNTWQAQHL